MIPVVCLQPVMERRTAHYLGTLYYLRELPVPALCLLRSSRMSALDLYLDDFQCRVLEGQLLSDLGRLEEAQRVLESVLQERQKVAPPLEGMARFSLYLVYRSQGNGELKAEANRVLALLGSYPRFGQVVGTLHMEAGRFKMAAKALRQAAGLGFAGLSLYLDLATCEVEMERDPAEVRSTLAPVFRAGDEDEKARSHYLLARLAHKREDWPEMRERAERGLKLAREDDARGLLSSALAKALMNLDPASAASARDHRLAALALLDDRPREVASLLLDDWRYHEALPIYEAQLEEVRNLKKAPVLIGQALCLCSSGHPGRALSVLQDLTSRPLTSEQRMNAYRLLSNAYLYLHRLPESLQALEEAWRHAEDEEDQANVLAEHASLAVARGLPEKAERLLDSADRIEGKERERSQLAIYRGEWEEAHRWLDRGHTQMVERGVCAVRSGGLIASIRAQVYLYQKQWGAALDCCGSALELLQDLPKHRFEISLLQAQGLAALGRAVNPRECEIDDYPENIQLKANALEARARVCFHQGKEKEGRQTLAELLSLRPVEAQAARCHYLLGEFKRCAELAPGSWMATKAGG